LLNKLALLNSTVVAAKTPKRPTYRATLPFNQQECAAAHDDMVVFAVVLGVGLDMQM
jgi:hypothetical protein